MVPFRIPGIRRFRRRFAGRVLVCFCLIGLTPTGYGKTDNVDKLILLPRNRNPEIRANAAVGLAKNKTSARSNLSSSP